jgi:hypothetical protein
MADGLFDWVAQELYHEVNFKYASSCAIDREEFAAGRALEKFVQDKYGVCAPPAGK